MDERRRFFEESATGWDDDHTRHISPERLREIVSLFSINDGDYILDVGCGTGILLPYLFEVKGKGRLAAIDFSFNMIKVARMRLAYMGISFVNGSVSAIPFQDRVFDKVVCFSAFPHFPDKKRACDEMARVLKQGSRLYIAHIHSSYEIENLHRGIGGAVKEDRLPDPKAMEELLQKSGFIHISIIDEPGKYIAQGIKR
ncbi:MAG: class I SAM-dependent methyltransferase [Syntrophorhabdaceae bacterium]|nr:class I SAM-dependent methyltransferase [Syntrophorhabdaceae bacterium]